MGRNVQVIPARRVLRALSALVAGSIAIVSFQLPAAADTPTFGGGDCWDLGTPYTCTWNWQGPNTPANNKIIDNFSSARPTWWAGVNDAMNRWNAAPGPASLAWWDQPYNVYVYVKFFATTSWWDEYGIIGHTWVCTFGDFCNGTGFSPIEIWYSNIDLYADYIDVWLPPSDFNKAVAHEMGHAMGLRHNSSGSSSLMKDFIGNMSANPTIQDYGHLPPCSTSQRGGLRCVYNTNW